jgi:hypothetical protein
VIAETTSLNQEDLDQYVMDVKVTEEPEYRETEEIHDQ